MKRALLLSGILGAIGSVAYSLYPTPAQAAYCDSTGFYTCSLTGAVFEYGQPKCNNGGLKPAMLNACKAACVGGTCVDSGWH
jgi:hypothetical protein